MTVLMVPPVEAEPWPSLGPAVADWIEKNLVFGPGDLLGQPAKVDDEKRLWLYRCYEIFPQDHPSAGRRRFRRADISVPKGLAKTEWAAWVSACELHPDAPVRFDHWDGHGTPWGHGVVDPYIPLVAYTEEQSDELAYAALMAILERSKVVDDFDIGLMRIMRRRGSGKAVSLASSPDARDGARTTFCVADETHRWVLPRLKAAHKTMLANLPKRRIADPWMLEITTMFTPGEGSVAEGTMNFVEAVRDGRLTDARIFCIHREASDEHDLGTRDGVRAAVVEAAGPVASKWRDVDGIVDQFFEADADLAYLQRVWLNRKTQSARQAFDVERWKQLANPHEVPEGELITLGFDGSRYHDSTGIVATHVHTGYQWLVGAWERPPTLRPEIDWEVPEHEVTLAMAGAFERWNVWRLYADPPYWETRIAEWSGEYGHERVIAWRTNRERPMSAALLSFDNAIKAGDLAHDGHPQLAAHIGNSCRRELSLRDDQGRRLWTIVKERPDSPHKIDLAIAACLSWEARRDAIAAGADVAEEPSVYEERGVIVLG